MDKPASITRSSAWGAACDSCAKAKARCIRSNKTPEAGCDRCRSLEKSCTERAYKPRKKRQIKHLKSQRSRLEERLSGVVDSLNQSERIPSLRDASPEPTGQRSPLGTVEFPARRQSDTLASAPLPGFNTFARPACTCDAAVDNEDINPAESDETVLSIYSNQLGTQFPFVVIPPGVTMAQLQRTRPFLTKVIGMVTSIRNRRSMWGQSRAVMQHISDAVFMRSERSLDLLQGIIAFLGYYHYFCLAHGQFNNLAHLAISMIGDMGLDRRVKPREKTRYLAMDPEEPRARTNEERRVLLGVWYMCSNAALAFNKVESPKYTRHHEQCLNELEDAAEYETDGLLVQLVRIQHLTDRIFQFTHRDQMVDELPVLALPETTVHMRFSALQAELDRLEYSLPERLKSNYLLSSHYSTAQLRLFEPLLSDISPSLANTEMFNHHHPATSVLNSWLNTWLAIPVCYYFHMPQPGYGHLIYAITMLVRQARLSLLSRAHPNRASSISDVPGVTVNTASIGLGTETSERLVLDALESLAARFGAARGEMGAAYGKVWENDFLDLVAKTLRGKKTRIERWSRILVTTGSGTCGDEAFQPRKDGIEPSSIEGQRGNVEAGKDTGGWLFEQLDDFLLDDDYQESWLWAGDPSDLFIYQNQGGLVDESVGTSDTSFRGI
ncbi:hypothetical protein V1507DRAFT_339903 [Lipomyces tetrasporus]